MKTFTTAFALAVLLSGAAFGQSAPDSTGRQQRQRQHRGYVDPNGDGINDRSQQRQERMRRRTDRFVDTNGDGISDGRECGLGFRRGTAAGKGTGKQSGQKGHGGR